MSCFHLLKAIYHTSRLKTGFVYDFDIYQPIKNKLYLQLKTSYIYECLVFAQFHFQLNVAHDAYLQSPNVHLFCVNVAGQNQL